MPTSGQDILRRISDFAANAGLSETEARSAAQATSIEIDQLVTSQSASFRELSQLYLPRIDDDVERDGWSEMRGVLQSILLRKDDARRQLTTQLQQTAEQRVLTENRWKQLCDRVNELTARCDDLGRKFAEQLSQDSQFQTLSKKAAEGQARLEQAHASLQDVEKDAAEKLPGFERSRLFGYLKDRGFGAEAYSSRGLTRWLDRWISRLIDYPRAAAGYKFLTSASRQMRQLIEEQQKLVKQLMAEVEARHSETAASLGLTQAQAEGSKVRGEQEVAAAAADAAQHAEDQARQKLTELDSPDCQFYREALTAFQGLIQRTERSLVAARAAQTPELTDDQVVARLKHIDDQVAEKKKQLDQYFATAQQASKRTARINELVSRCRRAQFDHPRRLFDDNFGLESQLAALLAGTVDVDHVYQDMYRHQHLDSPIADQASAAIQSPMAQILMQTMAQAAGAALGTYAARAGQQHRLPKSKSDWF